MEIHGSKKKSKLLLGKLPFQRLLREIGYNYGSCLRWKGDAITALQHVSEAYIVGLLENTNLCAVDEK